MARNSQYTCLVLMIFSVFGKVHGLAFVTEPNNTIVALTGFNQTFTWTLNLTEEDKLKQLKVQFGPWNKKNNHLSHSWMAFVQETTGQENKYRENHSTADRLFWTGDLSHDYYIAFQLVNIKRVDSGDYGIKLRANGAIPGDKNFPDNLESWFTLSVQDPPVKPTVDSRHIKLEVEEGHHVNITCRSSTQESSTVIWMRDRLPIHRGQSKILFIASVNRSQAGNYVCFSVNPTGNSTSAITTVNVVYAPSIHSSSKLVSVILLKGNSVTLKCEADGNPSPLFYWDKSNKRISEGFNSTWNSSTLMVTPINDEDFTHYVCTVKNRFGWDALTFQLRQKDPQAVANTKPADTDEGSLIKYVSISAVLAIVLICAFLAQRHVAKRNKMRRQNEAPDETRTQSPEMATTYSELNPFFSGDVEWEIPRANLNVEKVIGRGAFGVVSRGLALDLPGKPGWTVVAVKSIQEDASERERKDLLSEMSVLKHLDPHPHVIRLYGCVSTEARPLVVVEYAEYGDVLGYLRKSRGVRDNYYSDPSIKPHTSLTSKQLLKFSWEISDGMEYLSSKKIIHRDLAARNVLVGEEEVCKITDFGMARDVQEEDIYVRTHEGRLPIKWTAPEALFGSGAYTTASDVWSYGVVLYEIFTVGGDPFPGVYMRDIPDLLKNGYRMSRPKFISPKLYDIMMECWKNDPSHRPSFGCLSSTLHMLMEEEEQEYVNLKELFYENVLPTSC